MTTKKSLFISAGILFWSLTLIFTLLPSWPHIYYRLSPQTSTVLASTIASTASQAQAFPHTAYPYSNSHSNPQASSTGSRPLTPQRKWPYHRQDRGSWRNPRRRRLATNSQTRHLACSKLRHPHHERSTHYSSRPPLGLSRVVPFFQEAKLLLQSPPTQRR